MIKKRVSIPAVRMHEHERRMLLEGYVSAAKAIELAGVGHVSTVHRWSKAGKVRHKRVGQGRYAPWFIDVRSLLALFKGTPIAKEIEQYINEMVSSGKMAPAKVQGKPIAGALGGQGLPLAGPAGPRSPEGTGGA